MAYLAEMKIACLGYNCGKRAVVEVFSRFNQSCGKFCRVCGKRALARQEQTEKTPASRANDGRAK